MLGTGNAHCTRCYNTCFTLQDADGGILLVDAGGGNGILVQMERAGLRIEDVHDIFVTHAHTDHLLGVVWIVRMALEHGCRLNVWSHVRLALGQSAILPKRERASRGTSSSRTIWT